MLRRSTFLASGLAGAAAAGLRAPARAADELRVSTLPIDPTLAPFYAQQRGFFKKAGIDVRIATFTNGGASGAAMIGGAADVGLIDLVSMVSAHARGIPIAYLAPGALFTKQAPTYWLLVPKSSAIRGAKDMNGKTLAVNGLKNINQIPTQAWIDNNGGDSKTVRFIEMPYPSMLPALEKGTVQVAAVTEPTLAIAHDRFRVIQLTDGNVAPSFLVAGFAARREWIAQHADLARRFASAIDEANAWANGHHAESLEILQKVSKISPAVLQRMSRVEYGTKLDPQLIQPVVDASAKYGAIEKAFAAREIIAPSA